MAKIKQNLHKIKISEHLLRKRREKAEPCKKYLCFPQGIVKKQKGARHFVCRTPKKGRREKEKAYFNVTSTTVSIGSGKAGSTVIGSGPNMTNVWSG